MTIASDMGVLTLLSLLQALRAEERAKGKQGPPGPPGSGTPPSAASDAAAVPSAHAADDAAIHPEGAKTVLPSAADQALPSAAPSSAPTAEPGGIPAMAPWSGTQTQAPVPANLPPFPGPGWTPDTPVSSAIAARAKYWGPQLWNYGTKTIVKPFVQEQFGGRWLSFVAAWHPGDKGAQTFMAVEAWRLATALPIQETAPAKVPTTPPPSTQAVSLPPPANVMPYPGPGAWQSNSAYIQRLQSALTWVAWKLADATLDPHGVDGVMGPNTKNAVLAFQHRYQLTADGMAGKETASFLDDVVHGLGGKVSGFIRPPPRRTSAYRPPAPPKRKAPKRSSHRHVPAKKPHVTPAQRKAAQEQAKQGAAFAAHAAQASPGDGGGGGGGGGDMGPGPMPDMGPPPDDGGYDPGGYDPGGYDPGGYDPGGYDATADDSGYGYDDFSSDDGSDVSGGEVQPMQYGAWYRGRLFADLNDHDWDVNEVARLLSQSGWTKVTASWGPYEDEYQFQGQWLGAGGVDQIVHPDEPGLVYAEWPELAQRRMQRAS